MVIEVTTKSIGDAAQMLRTSTSSRLPEFTLKLFEKSYKERWTLEEVFPPRRGCGRTFGHAESGHTVTVATRC